MKNQYIFSNVTKNYLADFYCILDTMIEEMNSQELSKSISNNFIVQMIPHHQAAINMSTNILRYTTNITLQNIATNIVKSQTKSIEQMLAIQEHCLTFQNNEQDLSLYLRKNYLILETMYQEMGSAKATNDINADFIREIIPHHRGAIHMAENSLNYVLCPELKPTLDSMIISQTKEIQEMTHLLKYIRCN